MQTSTDNKLLRHVTKVEVAYRKDTANLLLEQGWVLLAVGEGQEQTGPYDYTPSFAYCLGKIGSNAVSDGEQPDDC
jgi:hypothetical protein